MSFTVKDREDLRSIIRKKCVKFGEFKLASGGTSSFFFDMKQATFDPEGSRLIAKALLEKIYEDGASYVGGLETGAIPMVASICTLSEKDRPVYGFFVRKSSDDRNANIEGVIEKGARVVVVEDVTTKGESALKAALAVRAYGCVVETVLTVVDRDAGAKQKFSENELNLVALYGKDDFVE